MSINSQSTKDLNSRVSHERLERVVMIHSMWEDERWIHECVGYNKNNVLPINTHFHILQVIPL